MPSHDTCAPKTSWRKSYPSNSRPLCIPLSTYCNKWWARLTGDQCHCHRCEAERGNKPHQAKNFEIEVEVTPPLSDYLNPLSPANIALKLFGDEEDEAMAAGYKVRKVINCGAKHSNDSPGHEGHGHPPVVVEEPYTDINGNKHPAHERKVWIFTMDGCTHCAKLMGEAKKDGVDFGYFETVSDEGCQRFKNTIGAEWNKQYSYPQMFVKTDDLGWYRVGGLREYKSMRQSIKDCIMSGNPTASCIQGQQESSQKSRKVARKSSIAI